MIMIVEEEVFTIDVSWNRCSTVHLIWVCIQSEMSKKTNERTNKQTKRNKRRTATVTYSSLFTGMVGEIETRAPLTSRRVIFDHLRREKNGDDVNNTNKVLWLHCDWIIERPLYLHISQGDVWLVSRQDKIIILTFHNAKKRCII